MNAMDTETLYQALSSRDPRHDGRFYVGVTTTGIYCRPICSARPLKEHVRFFKSKAEAEKAGFRPCLKCRPDLSPSSIQWQGTAAVVARALGMMNRGEADGSTLPSLAARLGITDRHLRRLFREHLGASPIEVAISRRLHLARQLLTQTRLSITDIALASGFSSLRRFNDAFLITYRRNPGDFRKSLVDSSGEAESIVLRLPYLDRYDWDTLLGYFARHEVFGIDAVQDGCYLRHLQTPGGECFLKVEHLEKHRSLQLSLQLTDFADLRYVVDTVRCVFDVDHNPRQVTLPSDCPEEARNLIEAQAGIRVPGAFDPLETAVGVVLGQLVSTRQGRLNLKKLVEKFGRKSSHPRHPQLYRLFPTAEVLASEDLSVLGFTRVRAEAIRDLAVASLDGRLDLSRSCDLAATRQALARIRGIGPWTVEMIALRCLGDTDAFPASDLVLKRALDKFAAPPARFSPWRSYLALALWKTETATPQEKAPASESAEVIATSWQRSTV